MSIKTYRPTTPARRQMTVSGFDGVAKHVKPEKSLVEVLKKNAGRNEHLIIEEAKKLAREKNISILSSLHDLNQAMDFGDRFFFMKDGTVKVSGGEECFCPEIIKDIFDIDVKIAEIDGRRIVLGGN